MEKQIEVAGCSTTHWGIADCPECGLKAEYQANATHSVPPVGSPPLKEESEDKQNVSTQGAERKVSKFTAYFRAFRGYCPACNSDAPAIDNCQVCYGWRASFPPANWLPPVWLMRFFEAHKQAIGVEDARTR